MADERRYNWAIIGYPESLVSNWLDILKDFHVPFLVSPLHDNDFNNDGSLKKPHYHIQFHFENKKSYNQVLKISESIKATVPIPLESYSAYARYLCHLDENDKTKYNYNDVIAYMIDYVELISQQTNEFDLIDEILTYIDSTCCTNFCDLVTYARENNVEWFRLLVKKNTYFFKEYQKSLEYKFRS